MPDEQLVEFTIVFEDQASEALRAAQASYDVASASFETGMFNIVDSMKGFEGGMDKFADFLSAAPQQLSTTNSGLAGMSMGFEEALKSVEKLEGATDFMANLPKDTLDIGFKDQVIKDLGVTMAKGFADNLTKADFAGDLSSSMGDAVLAAELQALGKKKKDEFLAGSGKSAGAGADPMKGMSAILKPLGMITGFLDKLKGFVLIAGIIKLIYDIFGPFIEIILDFVHAALVPFSEFFIQVALKSAPFWDELAKTIGELAQKYFPMMIDWFSNTFIPAIVTAFKTVKAWLEEELPAAWKKLKETFWVVYEDYLKPALEWVEKKFWELVEGVKYWKEQFDEAYPTLDKWAVILTGALAVGLTVVLVLLAKLAFAVLAATWPILLVIAIIGLAIAAFYNWDKVTEWFGKKWEAFTAWISGLWKSVKDAVIGYANDFVDYWVKKVESLINMAPEWGKSLINFFIDGILSAAKKLYEVVEGIFKKVRGFFPGSDAEWGPLSDLSLTGPALVETFVQGIEQKSPMAAVATARMMEDTSAELVATPERGGTAREDPVQPIVDAILLLQRVVETGLRLIDTTQGDQQVREELRALTGFSQ